MKKEVIQRGKEIVYWCSCNRVFTGIICLQALVVFYFTIQCFAPKTVVQVPLTSFAAGEDTGAVTVTDTSIEIQNKPEVSDIMLLDSQPLDLGFGAYTISVDYNSIGNAENPVCDIEDFSVAVYFDTLDTASGQGDSKLVLLLSDAATTLEGRIWTPFTENTNNLRLYYTGIGQTTITSVQIIEQVPWRFMVLGMVLLVCMFFDIVYYLFFAQTTQSSATLLQKAKMPLLITGVSFFATIPAMTDYIYRGHDLPFHMVRIASVAAELNNGQFPVRMMTEMLNGYGYANSLFYCDIFLYIPAILYHCMVSLQTAYHIYFALVNLATCAIAYYCFQKLSSSRSIAFTSATIYTLASYRLTNDYTRSAVGEYTAMAFFPLLVLGTWNIYTTQKPRWKDWLPLALGMAGIVQCHVLSVEMIVGFLLLCCLLLFKQTFQFARMKAFSFAGLLCAGVSAWFWVPLLDSMRRMSLNAFANVFTDIQENGISLAQLFSLSGYLSNGHSSNTLGMPLAIGWGLLVGVCIAGYYMLHRAKFVLEDNPIYHAMRICLVLGLVAMAFTLRAFPWTAIGYGVSARIATVLNVIQFPWRYLSIASIFLAVVSVFALMLLQRYHSGYLKGVMGLMLALTFVTTGLYYTDFVKITDTEERMVLGLQDRQIVILGEYLLDGSEVDSGLPKVVTSHLDATVSQYQKVDGVAYVTYTNNSESEQTLLLPIFNYPNYRATNTQTGDILPITNGENNRISLAVAAGTSGTIKVAYVAPWYWHVAEAISVLSWAFVAFMAVATRCKKRTTETVQLEEECRETADAT